MINKSFMITIFTICSALLNHANSDLSSFTCTENPPNTDNVTGIVNQLLQTVRESTRSINELRSLLFDLKNSSFTTRGTMNNLLLFVEELMAMHNVTSASPLPQSCQEIQQRMPTSPSGVYLIAASEKKTQYVYCYMDTLCNSDGGWTRLAHIDMTDPTENCPGGLRQHSANEVRGCGRPVSGGGSCHSIKYSSHGVQYSQVCGRAKGYAYHSPDAVDTTLRGTGRNNINSYYVDGLSISRGSPRKHIWTFMAGLKEDNSVGQGTYTCPCQTGSKQKNQIPYFVGDDYFCESGNPTQPTWFSSKLYTADPLWDGEKCRGLEASCCKKKFPWFHKSLSTITSDHIELRVCGDESTTNEDVAIQQFEIYVK